jgi:hypothetical protein
MEVVMKKRKSAWSGRVFVAHCKTQCKSFGHKKPGARNLGPVTDFTPLRQGALQREFI